MMLQAFIMFSAFSALVVICNILAAGDRVLNSSTELGDEIGVGESRVGCISTDTESAQDDVVVCVVEAAARASWLERCGAPTIQSLQYCAEARDGFAGC